MIARFPRKSAGISALTALAQNQRFADSRKFTHFECPILSENSFPRARVEWSFKVTVRADIVNVASTVSAGQAPCARGMV
jgi:hypothetical protein